MSNGKCSQDQLKARWKQWEIFWGKESTHETWDLIIYQTACETGSRNQAATNAMPDGACGNGQHAWQCLRCAARDVSIPKKASDANNIREIANMLCKCHANRGGEIYLIPTSTCNRVSGRLESANTDCHRMKVIHLTPGVMPLTSGLTAHAPFLVSLDTYGHVL